MPKALEYANIIAQMMRQSAEAQVENDARREDMAFRRQQAADALALQRENLALEGRRTDASVRLNEAQMRAAERGDLRDEEKYRREVDRQEQDDAEIEAAATLADNPDAMLGVKPLSESVGGKVKLRALGMRANKAKTEDEIAAAAEAPMEREQGRKLKAAQIDEAEARKRAADTQNRALEADMRFNGMMEQFKLDAAKESARGQRMENMERESSLYEAMTARAMNAAGIVSPAQQTAIQLEVAKMVPQAQIKAAFSAATVNDPLRGEVFDPTIFDARMKSLQAATGLATDLAAFKVSDPEGHAALQKRTSEAVMTALQSGASPQAAMQIAQTMVSAAAESRKAAESRTTTPPPDSIPSEGSRRLQIKADKAKDIESRIDFSIRETLKGLPDDVVAGLEAKYGMDQRKIIAAIRESLSSNSDSVPSNRMIAAAARLAAGMPTSVPDGRKLNVK